MDINSIGNAITGDALLDAMKSAKHQRKPIADGFLYEQTVNMVSAEPGVGKSTIFTQMAVELAAGLPIFGLFEVVKPVKVLFAQNERPLLEVLERLQVIGKTIPIKAENLVITDEYKAFNLLKEEHADMLIKCVHRDCPNVEVLILDPIYPLVPGGLSKDEPSSLFVKAMARLQKATSATMLYSHHNTKPQYEGGVKVEKTDPYFGTVWLKAHVTGSFSLVVHDNGVVLNKVKDNYCLLPDKIKLDYNPETGLCSVPTTDLPALERVKVFLKQMKEADKTFTFEDMEQATAVKTRRLREIKVHSSISDLFVVVSSIRNKDLYKVR